MKKNIYMICVLILLVVIAVFSAVIDKKIKADEETVSEEVLIETSNSINVPETVEKESIIEELKSSVVQIEAQVSDDTSEETLLGSGVIIQITDKYIDIVTASHLVEQTANPLIYFYDGSLAYGRVTAYGKENDIAFIRVEAEAFSEGIGDGLNVAVCANDDFYAGLQVSDEVFLIGSVTKVAGNVEVGTIKEKEQFVELFQNDMLICEAMVLNGMSGGGTFSGDGMLIGIIVGTNGSDAVSVAIPDVMAEYLNISQ